jgi:hypothetical protein
MSLTFIFVKVPAHPIPAALVGGSQVGYHGSPIDGPGRHAPADPVGGAGNQCDGVGQLHGSLVARAPRRRR